MTLAASRVLLVALSLSVMAGMVMPALARRALAQMNLERK